jgi:DNA-directed RNA polymerase specialized sigma24 family protein
MRGAEEVDQTPQGFGFEEFRSALRRGENLDRWSPLFGDVVDRVSVAVCRRMGDSDLAEEAVQSACRTFLRRAREGRFQLASVDDLIGLLVRIAFRKALRQTPVRGYGWDEGSSDRLQIPTPAEGDPDEYVTPEARDRLASAMTEHLRVMLEQVGSCLREGLHRDVLPYWFAREYQGRKITLREIGRCVGCSRATVDRICREIRQRWQPLVEDGRRLIRDLASELVQGEG